MEEMKRDKTRRGYALIGVLGVTVLALLMLVSISGATPYAYITTSGSNVSVIDTATNTVTTTVNVVGGAFGITVLPSATRVYVGNNGGNTVSVINTETNTVTATVNVGRSSAGISITPDGRKVFVGSNQMPGSVSVIDTATNTVTDIMQDLKVPIGVAATGTKLYVTEYLGARVSVINIGTNAILGRVTVGTKPYGVAVTPDRTKVYVANSGSDNVSVISAATNTVIATVDVGSNPRGISITPDGRKVYVTNGGETLFL